MANLDRHQFCNQQVFNILHEDSTGTMTKKLLIAVIMTNTASKGLIEYMVKVEYSNDYSKRELKPLEKMEDAINYYNQLEVPTS